MLRALRETYGIKMLEVRRALNYAERQLGVPRLFLSEHLRASPGGIFFDRYERLIDLSSGQMVLREIMRAYLERVVYQHGVAFRLYPLSHVEPQRAPRIVMLDPRIAYGRPIVEARGIKTATIAERFDVGESVLQIAEDYSLEPTHVEEAIRYERWSQKAA